MNEKIIIIILVVFVLYLLRTKDGFSDGRKIFTIVTGYFKVNRTRDYESYTQGRKTMPKDSDGVYKEWMKGLLSYKGSMIIFTDKESKNYIDKLRKGLPTRIITTKVEELEPYKYFKNNKLNEQNYGTMVWKGGKDSEVNKRLFTIWNSKFSLLKKAVEMNPFNTKYFSWYDIGYLRTVNKRLGYEWPDKEKLKILDDKILFNIIGGKDCKDGGTTTGGYIGCNTNNIHKVHKLFLENLKKRIKNNQFSGNDQELYQDLRCAHPDLIQGVRGMDLDYFPEGPGHVGGAWFHMIPYFYKKVFGIKKCDQTKGGDGC